VALKSCCRKVSLVEINGENGPRLNRGRKERDLLFDARYIIPGVAAGGRRAERRLGRGKAEPLLDARLGVAADGDLGFELRVGQIAALIDDGRAAHEQDAGSGENGKSHGFPVPEAHRSRPRAFC
jgi:hypothetical protein